MTEARHLRTAGFIACLIGVVLMMVGKYAPGFPAWVAYAGVGVVALGWGLFAWSMAKRAAIARARSQDITKAV